MPLMEISVVPLGTKTTSVSRYVAEAVGILRKEKGIKHTLVSMGTIIEADTVERLLEIAGKMHRVVFNGEIKRVVTTIKIDERKDKKLTMGGKIKSVQEKL
jgi:uncharacterized protein (TIGR00106 family)